MLRYLCLTLWQGCLIRCWSSLKAWGGGGNVTLLPQVSVNNLQIDSSSPPTIHKMRLGKLQSALHVWCQQGPKGCWTSTNNETQQETKPGTFLSPYYPHSALESKTRAWHAEPSWPSTFFLSGFNSSRELISCPYPEAAELYRSPFCFLPLCGQWNPSGN